MKKSLITIIIAAVLVVIFGLLLFTFQVRQSEVAVLTTFGKPAAHNIDQPNLYFKWPWPIQQVYRFDQRVQNFEDKFSENLTADNTLLQVSVYVGWRISDAKEFFPKFAGGSIPAAQRQLETMLRSAKAAAIGKHNLSDFVNAQPAGLKFEAIEDEIKTSVQNELAAHHYGMSIEFLGIKKLGLPENVTQTVFDRMKSERQKLISKAQFEGEGRGHQDQVRRRTPGGRCHCQRAGDRHPDRGPGRGRGRQDLERVPAESRAGGVPVAAGGPEKFAEPKGNPDFRRAHAAI
jgi:membrane protease subunit HflC